MVELKTARKPLLQLLLLLLLLSMQVFVLAHELDQGVTHNNSVCATCSIGSGLDGAITVNHSCPVTVQLGQAAPAVALASAVALLRLKPESRAPPATH